ncbi:MAG: hypothetical protein JST82_15470 [Bacteroidetes bacterium]|nr:hypothetical protein [Bacteroidota bacterium]
MATKKTEVKKEKKCFIITPIGHDNSDTRIKTDGLIKAVILPVLAELDIKGYAAHQIDITGSITKQIIQRIVEDDIVIANLTELNPNVMYELAVRHATRKPVVILAEFGTSLPFDIAQQNTIFYTNDMIGVDVLKPKLQAAIETCLKEQKPNNPIYDGIEESIMKEIAIKNSTDTEKYILDKLEELTYAINKIGTSNSRQPSIVDNAMFKILFDFSQQELVTKVLEDAGENISRAGIGFSAKLSGKPRGYIKVSGKILKIVYPKLYELGVNGLDYEASI